MITWTRLARKRCWVGATGSATFHDRERYMITQVGNGRHFAYEFVLHEQRERDGLVHLIAIARFPLLAEAKAGAKALEIIRTA